MRRLEKHQRFFAAVRRAGGKVEYYVTLTCAGSAGDVFGSDLLEQLAALRIDLSLEAFSAPGLRQPARVRGEGHIGQGGSASGATKPGRLLITVEGAFDVRPGGVTILPEVQLRTQTAPQRIVVELQRPDGQRLAAQAIASYVFSVPRQPDKVRGHELQLLGLTKHEVPVGTQVWLTEEP
ncbi:hypothetical protein FGE12_25160 [Aggregicoccus sp. 17bor-14]|uniref:hypothetical protein n=1 Tax=Myxococcaceae TaxID=31 RepID=UPI00129D1AB2|nr:MULTISPECIES: hypothetical protein [Myxococcaceae]MRI91457.1 hypothetical protein [Aggregicoccus sp. 17bor-14]